MSKLLGKLRWKQMKKGWLHFSADRCKSRFKMDCVYLNDELEDKEICCPICGISEKLNTFWPEEVIEEAKKMALVEADRVIAEAFKGINSKYIKIKNTPIQKVDTNITIKNKDYDMRQVRVGML
ncbi:MAG: hypothetical protein ACLTJ5_04360 [Clostridium sp.]